MKVTSSHQSSAAPMDFLGNRLSRNNFSRKGLGLSPFASRCNVDRVIAELYAGVISQACNRKFCWKSSV